MTHDHPKLVSSGATRRQTPYGFEFGPAKVERCSEIKGNVIISITTPRQLLYVRVTPSGMIKIDEPIRHQGAV